MPSYQSFTTARGTVPDPVALRLSVQLATADPTAILIHTGTGWRGKKAANWILSEINATQLALDQTPTWTATLQQQQGIDRLTVREKAQDLALLDQINLIRSKLAPPLGAITVPQAISAIRQKAGEL